jgi:hypothetical protein
MKLLASIVLLASGAFAQNYIQKVVELKHIDPDTVVRLMYVNPPVKDGYVAQLRANKELGIVTVYGLPNDVEQIAANIAALDKPRPGSAANRNMDLRVYMLVAAMSSANGSEPPKELDPVLAELRASFGYKEIRLLDAAMVRLRQNERSQTRGALPCQTSEPDKHGRTCGYDLSVRVGSLRPPRQVLTVEGLTFQASFPVSIGVPDRNVAINTSFDVADGQKVVIGKSNIDGADRSLVLVVTAKAVD